MKKIIVSMCLLFSATGFAATNSFDLKMDLSLDGKKIASPRMIVNEGKLASVSQKSEAGENFLEVVATQTNDAGIMMKFKVGYIGENGKRKIVGEPTIIARDGEPARIDISESPNAPASLSLSVSAKKVSL